MSEILNYAVYRIDIEEIENSDDWFDSTGKLKYKREFLAETYPACQICGWRRAVEAHHVVYGCYGANKDDRKQISVCRECHLWCHANKHESIEKFESLADENWEKYKQI